MPTIIHSSGEAEQTKSVGQRPRRAFHKKNFTFGGRSDFHNLFHGIKGPDEHKISLLKKRYNQKKYLALRYSQ